MEHIENRDSLVIRSPEDAVSAVPYLLGFHPSESLVAVGYGGPHGTCALRSDLPRSAADAAEVAERLAEMLVRNRFEDVLLIGYGSGEAVTPVAEAAGLAIARHGLQVREMLRVDGGRWWSYLCGDARCCPAEGTPFDIRSTAVAAQATVAGQVAYSDRAELAATIAPYTGPARTAMREATKRAEHRLTPPTPSTTAPPKTTEPPNLRRPPPSVTATPETTEHPEPGQPPPTSTATPETTGCSDLRQSPPTPSGSATRKTTERPDPRQPRTPAEAAPGRWTPDQRVAKGVPLVRDLLTRLGQPDGAEAIEKFLADDEYVAWLGVVLTHIRVRDEAWVRIDADRPEPHNALWREVLRRVEPPYAAAPACLLAYGAFLAGDGGLANVALDRADQADPHYTMASLLREVMQAGLPPTAARLRMSPEDLAEAWELNLTRKGEGKEPQLEDRSW